MVRVPPPYDPPTNLTTTDSIAVRFNLRVMTRTGEQLIGFDEFRDIISYNDSLSIESAAGNFTLQMRAIASNENLLKSLHPGCVIEIYCRPNAEPLENVTGFSPTASPAVYQEEVGLNGNLTTPEFTNDGQVVQLPAADEIDYLDLAPGLLLRGIVGSYGRSTDPMGGSSLVISGESYGAIYRKMHIAPDVKSPTSLGQSFQTRFNTLNVNGVVPLVFAALRHWTEEFWGAPTGWEARIRVPFPIPLDVMTRFPEGSVWSALQHLSMKGLMHIWCDHTGAINFQKLPYSSKDAALVDPVLIDAGVPAEALTNWEDIPLIQLPSKLIVSWADRLSLDGVANFIRVRISDYGGGGSSFSTMDAATVYNTGSLTQYGYRKLEINLPASNSLYPPVSQDEIAERGFQEQRLTRFLDSTAVEVARWYSRPIQQCILKVRGDSVWRLGTRISLTENWAYPEAVPAEYYVLSRSHQIDFSSGAWQTTIECVRDRRLAYLGIGTEPAQLDKLGTAEDGLYMPVEPDRYFYFDRRIGSPRVIEVGTYEALTQRLG